MAVKKTKQGVRDLSSIPTKKKEEKKETASSLCPHPAEEQKKLRMSGLKWMKCTACDYMRCVEFDNEFY